MKRNILSFSLWVASLWGAALPADLNAPVHADAVSVSRPVSIYTHGYGPYAVLNDDGSITGPGVDVLSCALGKMNISYEINIVPMVRAGRLFENETLDIWFPTFHWKTRKNEELIIGKLGTREVSWYTLKSSELQPNHPDFKTKARVATFANTGPEKMVRRAGYKLAKATDDENQLALWLFEGQVDALLSLDFRHLLSPGLQNRFHLVRETYFETFRMGFELARHFDEKYPAFRPAFTRHLKSCELPPGYPEHNHQKDH